mgnify:CR=1 FL=1
MRHVQAESSSPVDWVSLLQAMGGDRDILVEVARLFLEFGPDQVLAVEEALSHGDAATLRSTAHRLKGSLAQLHVDSATEHAAELEQYGQRGELGPARGLWLTLREEVNQIQQAIEDWLR